MTGQTIDRFQERVITQLATLDTLSKSTAEAIARVERKQETQNGAMRDALIRNSVLENRVSGIEKDLESLAEKTIFEIKMFTERIETAIKSGGGKPGENSTKNKDTIELVGAIMGWVFKAAAGVAVIILSINFPEAVNTIARIFGAGP